MEYNDRLRSQDQASKEWMARASEEWKTMDRRMKEGFADRVRGVCSHVCRWHFANRLRGVAVNGADLSCGHIKLLNLLWKLSGFFLDRKFVERAKQ